MQKWSAREMSTPHIIVISDLPNNLISGGAFQDFKVIINYDFPDNDIEHTYRVRGLMDGVARSHPPVYLGSP